MINEKAKPAPVRLWTSESLPSEVGAVIDLWARTEGIVHVAVMPDVHLGEAMCIGCAVASADLVFPEAVGADIGCGMTAVRFGPGPYSITAEDVATRIMDGLYRDVPANYHQRRSPPVLDPALSQTDLSDEALTRQLRNDGVLQFGTVGSGNHFVELQADEDGFLWVMVHTGSRGLGQSVHKHHLSRCSKTETGLRCIVAGSDEGRAYLNDAGWLVTYASASRRAIVSAVSRILQDVCGLEPDMATLIDCPHNFVRQEAHFGRSLWVHRKGAI